MLRRGLDYLEQTERERCPCTCARATRRTRTEIRNRDAEHSLDCPAFARADVNSMRVALERLCRESLRMEKVDEGFEALCKLGVLS